MGKQKIAIQMNMKDSKRRSKVQQIVVKHHGVTSVKIEGEDDDQVVIEGEGIDVVKITQALRKKICHGEAKVLTVEPVKEKKKEEKADDDELRQHVGFLHPYNLYAPYNQYDIYEIPDRDQPSCCVL